MALRDPFEFDITPEPATGEKLVSVADPLGSAAGPATYYLARRFAFTEGDYTFTITADDAATVWIGTSQFNSRMIGSCTLSAPSTFTVNIPAGDYRIDVILQNVPPGASPCCFTMVIKSGNKIVYSSAKEGWRLDDAQIADDDLPESGDYRRDLPVLTVLPNWQNGILERLSWLTDVLDSERGAEQRRSVRRNARRSFDVQFLRQRAQRDRLDTFFVGVGTTQFMMPLWHEAVKMLDGIAMGAAGVFFDDGQFNMREFRKGDLVFVNAGNPDDYDVLEVGDTEQNRFSWAEPPPRAWPKGTRIYPMRVAKMREVNPQMSNVTDTVSRVAVRFDLVEPYAVPPAWGGNFGGEPLFRYTPDRVQPLEVQYDQKSYTMDNNSGVPVDTNHGLYTTAQVSMKLSLFGRANAYSFRQFLQAARGQARHFYMPTFMQDIELAEDVPQDTIDLHIQNQGYFSYMLRPQPLRLQLAFQFRNGSQTLYRIIENVQPVYKLNPNGEASFPLQIVSELLTLDSPLPAIRISELKRISFISETRFAQDTFEILHPTNGQEQIQTSLVFRQMRNQRKLP